MTFKWPPIWLSKDSLQPSPEEPAIVKHVFEDRMGRNCFLIVDQRGLGYVALLEFNDSQACSRAAKILSNHIGRSIHDIRDTDWSAL